MTQRYYLTIIDAYSYFIITHLNPQILLHVFIMPFKANWYHINREPSEDLCCLSLVVFSCFLFHSLKAKRDNFWSLCDLFISFKWRFYWNDSTAVSAFVSCLITSSRDEINPCSDQGGSSTTKRKVLARTSAVRW